MVRVKNIIFSLIIPVVMFVVFFLISSANGVPYGTTTIFWELLLERVIASVCIAYALATQIKNGRFDFSGGAVMTLGAIGAGYICKSLGFGFYMILILCLIFCLIESLCVAFVYVYGKLPIIICTIGMALVFEALTNLINKGNGVAIASDMALSRLGKLPWELLPLILGIVVYYVYNTYTVSGKKALLLANNQESAVNIGVREGKNVFQTFMISGVLYGMAAAILVSQASPSLPAVTTTLGTVGTAFASILPVFMGFFIGGFINDTIGIFLATLSVQFMSYGIEINTPSNVRSAYNNICTGVFMVVFFLVSEQGRELLHRLKKEKARVRDYD